MALWMNSEPHSMTYIYDFFLFIPQPVHDALLFPHYEGRWGAATAQQNHYGLLLWLHNGGTSLPLTSRGQKLCMSSHADRKKRKSSKTENSVKKNLQICKKNWYPQSMDSITAIDLHLTKWQLN